MKQLNSINTTPRTQNWVSNSNYVSYLKSKIRLFVLWITLTGFLSWCWLEPSKPIPEQNATIIKVRVVEEEWYYYVSWEEAWIVTGAVLWWIPGAVIWNMFDDDGYWKKWKIKSYIVYLDDWFVFKTRTKNDKWQIINIWPYKNEVLKNIAKNKH